MPGWPMNPIRARSNSGAGRNGRRVVPGRVIVVLDRTPFTTWGGYGGLAFRGAGDWTDTRILLAGCHGLGRQLDHAVVQEHRGDVGTEGPVVVNFALTAADVGPRLSRCVTGVDPTLANAYNQRSIARSRMEDDEGAAVVARYDDEDDRTDEVGDGPADLRAVLQLQVAHRVR